MKSTLVACLAIVMVFATSAASSADPLPDGFTPNRLNAEFPPVAENGEVTFHIEPQNCSNVDYDNGSGETDCLNGNARSGMVYGTKARLGDTVEYKFDIWVDPSMTYAGYSQGENVPFGGRGIDTRLRVASWEGPERKNFTDMVKVDAKLGIAFRFKQCQAPEDFGKWVTFSMKIRWANDTKGWILVTCDDRPVFVAEGVVTNEQVHCYYGNECDPQDPIKNAKSFTYILGPVMNGWGQNWKDLYGPTIGQFTDFDAAGITIKMRNISITKGVSLYTDADKEVVKQLQARLNQLGCDVGAPDGVAGNRTRQAALTCRAIEGLPSEFNVTNVQTFLDLYATAT